MQLAFWGETRTVCKRCKSTRLQLPLAAEMDHSLLVIIGLCLVLGVILAFTVQTARSARDNHETWRNAEDGHQTIGAPIQPELTNRKLHARRPRRYLDTEYWLAAGGDILASDILSLTRPESQPKTHLD
jgi:hypothetical protein